MACGFEKELLSALVDGELSERERGRVQGHIDACIECRKEFADVQSASSMLHQVAPAKAPASILKAVEREIGREPQGNEGFFARYRRALHGAFALAGAVLIVLTVVALLGNTRSHELADAKAAPRPAAPITKMPAQEQAEKEFEPRAKTFKQEDPVRAVPPEKQLEGSADKANSAPNLREDSERKADKDGRRERGALPSATPPAAAKPNAREPIESPADEAKRMDRKIQDLAKEENAPTGKAAESAPAPAPPEEKGGESEDDRLGKAKKEGATIGPRQVTIILYAEKLSDARELVNKELAKVTKNASFQDATFTATMNSESSNRLVKSLKTSRMLDCVELPVDKAKALPDLAERSRDAWEDSMAFGKAKDSGPATEAKKAPSLESRQKPVTPGFMPAQANRAEAARGSPAPGAPVPPQAPAPQPQAGGGKGQAEAIPAPAPDPAIDSGSGSHETVVIRIHLMPKSSANMMNEKLRALDREK